MNKENKSRVFLFRLILISPSILQTIEQRITEQSFTMQSVWYPHISLEKSIAVSKEMMIIHRYNLLMNSLVVVRLFESYMMIDNNLFLFSSQSECM